MCCTTVMHQISVGQEGGAAVRRRFMMEIIFRGLAVYLSVFLCRWQGGWKLESLQQQHRNNRANPSLKRATQERHPAPRLARCQLHPCSNTHTHAGTRSSQAASTAEPPRHSLSSPRSDFASIIVVSFNLGRRLRPRYQACSTCKNKQPVFAQDRAEASSLAAGTDGTPAMQPASTTTALCSCGPRSRHAAVLTYAAPRMH